jgi:hypothetical protein
MSEWAAAWPQRAWMRPGHGKTSGAEFRDAFGADIDTILCCMQKPDARGCRKRSIGPTLAEVRLDAAGNLDPAAWTTAPGSATDSCLPD